VFKVSVVVAAVLFPALAVAQPVQGLYVSGDVGANFTNSMLSSNTDLRVDSNTGPVGLAALGWGFGNGFRAEIEGSYRSNSAESLQTRRTSGALEPVANIQGHVGASAAMANLAYDFPLSPRWVIRPYVGAGVGYGWLGLNGVHGSESIVFNLPENNTFTGPGTISLGTAGAVAYQAIAGAALPIRQVPGLELTAEYRFFGTGRANAPVTRVASGGVTVNGATPSTRNHVELSAQDNSLLFGARYRFGPTR
jgi:OOP family OmpA-OmpF porin